MLLRVGLLVVWAGAADAQTQLDEGKTAPQLFSSICSGCHKSPRGLAKESNSSSLASFLRAHYTTGREEAALLAGYVLSAGPAANEARGQQSGGRAERATEPRPPSAVEARPSEEQAPPRPSRPAGQAQAEPQTPAGESRRPPTRPAAPDGGRARAQDQSATRPGVLPRGAAADARSAAPAVPARTDDITD